MSRKKPKQERSQKRIEKILDSTNEIIEHESLKKISTNYISKKSGISIGSIYQYFRNKDEIYKALYEHLNPKVDNILDEEDTASKSTDESFIKMEKAMDRLIDQFVRFKKHIRIYNKIIDRMGIQQLIVNSRRKTSRRISKYLESDFSISQERAHIMSYMLVNSFLGTVHNHLWEDNLGELSLDTNQLKMEVKTMARHYILSELNTAPKEVSAT